MIRPVALLCLCTVSVLAQAPADAEIVQAPADAWPMFRGNLKGTGNSAAELPENLAVKWQVAFPGDAIEATAAIAGGTAYVCTYNGVAVALDLKTGDETWRYTDPDKFGGRSSPVIAGDLLVYGDAVGKVRALDRKDGKPRWSVDTETEIISSPIVTDGLVVFGGDDGRLYAVEAATGAKKWTFETGQPIQCSVTLAVLVGDVAGKSERAVGFAGCDGVLRFVGIDGGREIRSMQLGGHLIATPAIVGDRLYLASIESEVVGIDLTDMSRLWTFTPERESEFRSSPAVSESSVFIGGRGRVLHALDRKTGKERWSLRTRGQIDASPVVVGGRVLVGSQDKTFYVVDAQSGRKLFDHRTDGGIVAGAAVADATIVLGTTAGTVYAFGSR